MSSSAANLSITIYETRTRVNMIALKCEVHCSRCKHYAMRVISTQTKVVSSLNVHHNVEWQEINYGGQYNTADSTNQLFCKDTRTDSLFHWEWTISQQFAWANQLICMPHKTVWGCKSHWCTWTIANTLSCHSKWQCLSRYSVHFPFHVWLHEVLYKV